jgi:uncharacterized protein (DUF1499 family)
LKPLWSSGVAARPVFAEENLARAQIRPGGTSWRDFVREVVRVAWFAILIQSLNLVQAQQARVLGFVEDLHHHLARELSVREILQKSRCGT